MPDEVVVITGIPGSGKTTLAGPLAAAIAAPLIARDVIKEAMGDVFGEVDEEQSRRLGAASYAVLFALARTVPGRLVLESNFGPQSVPQLRDLTSRVVQVFCTCDVDVAVHRYNNRRRHPVHRRQTVTPAELRDMGPAKPLHLGGALIQVDTNAPVDPRSIEQEVRAALA